MVRKLSYPFRRKAGATFRICILLFFGRKLSFQKLRRTLYSSVMGLLSYHGLVCFSSCILSIPAFNLSNERSPIPSVGNGTLIFPEISHFDIFVNYYLITRTNKQNFQREKKIESDRAGFFFLPSAGSMNRLKFVSEGRYEVCTDNLPVLRDRMFV